MKTQYKVKIENKEQMADLFKILTLSNGYELYNNNQLLVVQEYDECYNNYFWIVCDFIIDNNYKNKEIILKTTKFDIKYIL